MTPSDAVAAFRAFFGDRAPTVEEARMLASLVNSGLHDGAFVNYRAIEPLSEAYPTIHWRVALDRRGSHTHTFVTIEKDDPREHYVAGSWCPHCGKDHRREPVPAPPEGGEKP